MAKHYGIPYQGSKGRLALALHAHLPAGSRFVDLFGGGFAMSHAALLIRGKYGRVLYNELDPVLVELVRRAMRGEYSYERFLPEWVSHEDFEARKATDGYVRYVWSFGNDGRSYMFGRDVEPVKRALHMYAVYGEPLAGLPTGGTIHQRRMALKRHGRRVAEGLLRQGDPRTKRQIESVYELQQLEHLERLQQLERMEKRLERLEFRCGDYRAYEHEDGDVVYCDPPYEGTKGYASGFDHAAFYDWAASRPYPVWFSSYRIEDPRFEMVWARRTRGLQGGAAGAVYNYECLYRNGAAS